MRVSPDDRGNLAQLGLTILVAGLVASRLPWESAPVEDLHFTPGYPRTVLGSASVFF